MRKPIQILLSFVFCLLSFVSIGQGVKIGFGGGGGGTAETVYFDNVAALLNDTELTVGDIAITKGYASVADGGMATFYVQADSVAGYATDSVAVVPVSAGYAVMQYESGYKFTAFNIRASNDSTENRYRLQRLGDYVGVTQKPNTYFNEADTIKLNSTTSITFQYPGQDWNIIGIDSSQCYFDIYPKDVGSTNTAVFALGQASNSDQLGKFSLSGLKFIMPDTMDTASLPTNVSAVTLLAGGAEVTLNKVANEGAAKMFVYFGGANTDDGLTKRVLSIYNSRIHAWDDANGDATGIQYSGGRWENYLYVDNCRFTGSAGTGHQLYVQPWLNWHISNTTIGVDYLGGSSQVFQANQTTGGDWPTWVPTKFQVLENVTFVSGSYAGFNIDKNYFPNPVFTNCTFLNSSQHADLKNYATFTGCYFQNGLGIRFNTDGGEGIINVSNCTFNDDSGVTLTGGTAAKDIYLNITGSQFITSSSNIFSSTLSATDTTKAVYNFSNCSIVNTTNAIYPVYIGSSSTARTEYYFNDCYFEGEIFLLRPGDNWRCHVDGGTWRGGGRDFYTNLNVDETDAIFTIKDLKKADYNYINAEDRRAYTDLDNTRAQWFLPPYKWLNDVELQSDNTVDSLNIGHKFYNIANSNSYDSLVNVYLYNESAAFGITVPTSDRYTGKWFRGEIHLRAKDEFILGNSGNINISRPYTVAAGTTAILEWDFENIRWDCQNCDIEATKYQYIHLTPIASGTALTTATDMSGAQFVISPDLAGGTIDSIYYAITGTAGATSGTMTLRLERYNSSNVFQSSGGSNVFAVGDLRASAAVGITTVVGDLYQLDVQAESFATDAEGLSVILKYRLPD